MRLLRSIALVGVVLVAYSAPASASLQYAAGPDSTESFPTNNFGFAHSGVAYSGEVAYLFVVTNAGISTYVDSTVGPYDGNDDTQVAVLNKSSTSFTSIHLSGTADIFGFDGDGIDTYGAPGNGTDTSGYGGPKTYFTGINGAATSGTANFIGGIASGTSTYFSLEEAPSTIGSITVSSTPEPSSFLTAAAGAIGLVGYGVSRRRKSRTA